MGSLLRSLLAALLLCALAIPARAAWHEARSEHFIIYADLRPAELRQFAERLESFDQAVRVLRVMDDPPLTDSERLKIYVLNDPAAVQRLIGRSNALGLYVANASGAAAFVPRRVGRGNSLRELDAEGIFFHEYAHHLQLKDTGAALPAWIIEGFAEFFATARVQPDGSVLIGAPPHYRARGLFYLDGLPLEQILGASYGRLDSGQMESLYGQSWLLTHYLTFEPSRKGQLQRYAESIQQEMAPLDAAKAAFGDLRALDRELARYKRRKIGAVTVDANRLSIKPIAIRPLRPGEAAVMSVHIRSRRGVDAETAPAVAADARRAAAAHPGDPFAQTALAEAEYDAGNHAAAEAAADRALAADPQHVRALIYKGRARMALAKDDPAKADWEEVRSWFLRANRLDTENAEPLMLFYNSFALAGVRPTKNAVEALLYAIALAPQDQGLRITAVRQLLMDNRLAEAKSHFAPLAAAPHAGEEWREHSGRIMAAIASGDSKAALALIESAPKSDEEDS